jgi:hypothetical protein
MNKQRQLFYCGQVWHLPMYGSFLWLQNFPTVVGMPINVCCKSLAII